MRITHGREHHHAEDHGQVAAGNRATERPPSPGRLKTLSMKITPPSAVPMSIPIIVTTGSIA